MAFKPIRDYVLIKPDKEEIEKKKGELYIVHKDSTRGKYGTVLAVGTGKVVNGSTVPMQTKAGDRVLFQEFVGTEVEVNGMSCRFMKEEDIIGIFTENAPAVNKVA